MYTTHKDRKDEIKERDIEEFAQYFPEFISKISHIVGLRYRSHCINLPVVRLDQ